jgi:hypothetical protein
MYSSVVDSDPDPFQPNVIPEILNIRFKMMKIMTPMTLMRMTKHCKLALILIKVKKDYGFPTRHLI